MTNSRREGGVGYLVSSVNPSWEGGSCNRHLNHAWIMSLSMFSAWIAVVAEGQGKMWHRNRQQKLQPIILHIAAFNSRHSFSSHNHYGSWLWKCLGRPRWVSPFWRSPSREPKKHQRKKKELLLLRRVHTRTPRVPRSAPLNNNFFSPNILDSHDRL